MYSIFYKRYLYLKYAVYLSIVLIYFCYIHVYIYTNPNTLTHWECE